MNDKLLIALLLMGAGFAVLIQQRIATAIIRKV